MRIPCRSSACLGLALLGAVLHFGGCAPTGGTATSAVEDDFPGITYPTWEARPPAPGSLAGSVWLVGIDGATWDIVRPLLDQGELPNFRRLMDGGARGTLLSEEPTISPALWATIASGVPRHVHGVDNFEVKLPGSYDVAEAGPLDRRAPAVWELVGAAGGRSIVVSWFGSYPAEEIPGAYVSKGFDPERPRDGQVHPRELVEVLRRETVVSLPRDAAEQIARTEFLKKRLIEDARTMAVLEVLASRERADFVAVYFSGVDVVQHVTWKHMDPSYVPFPGDDPRLEALAGVIPAYYRYVDHLLGRLLALAPEGTTFVVVSDHGGGPMEPEDAYHFQLEVLLRILGYTRMRASDPEKIDGPRTTAFTISELHRDEKRIWLNLAGVEADGSIPLAEATSTAQRLRRRLERLRTGSGAPLFDSVEVHTEDPRWKPGDAALTVRFSGDALLAETVTDDDREFALGPVRLRHRDVSGGHRLEGIFIANGPSVRPGALPRAASLYNIAPTILYLLGLLQDQRMLRHAPTEGGVLEAIISPEALAASPIRTIGEYPGVDRAEKLRDTSSPAVDPSREEAIEKLRGLGYIQ